MNKTQRYHFILSPTCIDKEMCYHDIEKGLMGILKRIGLGAEWMVSTIFPGTGCSAMSPGFDALTSLVGEIHVPAHVIRSMYATDYAVTLSDEEACEVFPSLMQQARFVEGYTSEVYMQRAAALQNPRIVPAPVRSAAEILASNAALLKSQ